MLPGNIIFFVFGIKTLQKGGAILLDFRKRWHPSFTKICAIPVAAIGPKPAEMRSSILYLIFIAYTCTLT